MIRYGFWKKVRKPMSVLAPMANVTDSVFRQIIARRGKPDVFWTEFISADGLCSSGAKHFEPDLSFSKKERPIVLQLFGAKPENLYKAARIGKERGFDGIDVNMGCPDKSVEKQGAGAALIKNISLAKEIISAVKKGGQTLPVSVKTRIGYHKDETDEWIAGLLKTELAVLTIHARTRKQMSKVPASWDAISRAVELRNRLGSKTYIIGNGDVANLNDGKLLVKKTGCDGIMYGRAIFGNPWLFSGINKTNMPLSMRLDTLVEHVKLFESTFKDKKNFSLMKKHFKAYAGDFEGAKALRIILMEANSSTEVENAVMKYKKTFSK